MKTLSAIFGFAVLVLVLCFALSNRQSISVAMWPLEETVTVQLYLVGLAPLAFGLIFGGAFGWLGGVPSRFHIRRLKKELETLNGKICGLQKNAESRLALPPRQKHFWERKS